MLSFLGLPLPFMKSSFAGKFIACLRVEEELLICVAAALFREREDDAEVGEPNENVLSNLLPLLEPMLALREGGEADTLGGKYEVGDTGLSVGVVLAIVPPTPIRSIGEMVLTFRVIEQDVGCDSVVVPAENALKPEDVFGRFAARLEGAGVELLARWNSCLVVQEVEGREVLEGRGSSGACCIASAIISLRGALVPAAVVVPFPMGDSNKPNCGRGGRSGIVFSLT